MTLEKKVAIGKGNKVIEVAVIGVDSSLDF